MCMINSSSTKRSKKDMKCYKIVAYDRENSLVKSIFYEKDFKLNVEYQEGSEDEFSSNLSSEKGAGGFHSFVDFEEALSYFRVVQSHFSLISEIVLAEGIIPKNSLYCTGGMKHDSSLRNYFSHKIIIKNVLLSNRRV